MAIKYYAKLDETKHIETIYLEGQLKDNSGLTLINVPEQWIDLFIRDWTSFYIKGDGSLSFDNQKANKTQQQINNLASTVDQLLADSAKGVE